LALFQLIRQLLKNISDSGFCKTSKLSRRISQNNPCGKIILPLRQNVADALEEYGEVLLFCDKPIDFAKGLEG